MPKLELPIHLVLLTLDDDTLLGEALLFPKISCLGDNQEEVVSHLKAQAIQTIEDTATPLSELYRFIYAEEPYLAELELPLQPCSEKLVWKESFALRYHEVRRCLNPTHLASFIPSLGIEVVAQDEEQLLQRAPADIRQALRRGQRTQSLDLLNRTQRVREVHLFKDSIEVALLTPKQLSNDQVMREKATLPTIADNLGNGNLPLFTNETRKWRSWPKSLRPTKGAAF